MVDPEDSKTAVDTLRLKELQKSTYKGSKRLVLTNQS
jgi:hypothetical protein